MKRERVPHSDSVVGARHDFREQKSMMSKSRWTAWKQSLLGYMHVVCVALARANRIFMCLNSYLDVNCLAWQRRCCSGSKLKPNTRNAINFIFWPKRILCSKLQNIHFGIESLGWRRRHHRHHHHHRRRRRRRRHCRRLSSLPISLQHIDGEHLAGRRMSCALIYAGQTVRLAADSENWKRNYLISLRTAGM